MLAIVECSAYGKSPHFGVSHDPGRVFAFHTSTYTRASDDAHVYLIHLMLNRNVAHMQRQNVIDMGCILDYDCSVVVNATIRFNFCTEPQEQARPYFLTIPQEWALQIAFSNPTDHYPLFSAFVKVR